MINNVVLHENVFRYTRVNCLCRKWCSLLRYDIILSTFLIMNVHLLLWLAACSSGWCLYFGLETRMLLGTGWSAVVNKGSCTSVLPSDRKEEMRQCLWTPRGSRQCQTHPDVQCIWQKSILNIIIPSDVSSSFACMKDHIGKAQS